MCLKILQYLGPKGYTYIWNIDTFWFTGIEVLEKNSHDICGMF